MSEGTEKLQSKEYDFGSDHMHASHLLIVLVRTHVMLDMRNVPKKTDKN